MSTSKAKTATGEWLTGFSIETDVPGGYSIDVGEQIPPYLRSGYSGKYIPKERRVVGTGGIVYDCNEVRQLLAASDASLSPITGKPLRFDDFLDEAHELKSSAFSQKVH